MRPILILILLSGHSIAYSQNLLPNSGFEDENICIEYTKNCAPEAWIATSLFANYYFDASISGAANAHKGTHYIGLSAGNLTVHNIRNFLRTQLLCSLRKGHQYQLEFYVRSLHPILDSIGIYFSAQDFLYERRFFKLLSPQLWSTNGLKTGVDASVWQKVHLIYTADGTENFMTIGNFKKNDYTGITRAEYRNDYYFFLDDVSLVPVDMKEKICSQADSVRKEIYSQNERHSYLERKVYLYRRSPPPVKPLPPTEEEKKKQQIDTLIIPDIFFATASYELNKTSYNLLDSFAGKISTAVVDSMIVEGHTDSIGKLAYNEALSLNRAQSVMNYLSGKVAGLDAKSVSRGFAFHRPIASNKTPQGRQLNRRVEIFLYKRE